MLAATVAAADGFDGRPIQFTDTEDVVATATVGGLTAAFIVRWDEAVDRVARDSPDALPYAVVHQTARLAGWYGNNDRNALIAFGAVTGAVALGGIIDDNDYVLDTAGIMLESGAVTFLAVGLLKLVAGRQRPYVDAGAHQWNFFALGRGRDHRSFPSGHSATAWSMATTAAKRHPQWWIQVPGYTFATAAGFQRVDSREHWSSDVLVGAAIGYVVSTLLVDHHEDESGNGGPTANMISVAWRF